MQILINTNRERYWPSIHSQIEKEIEEVQKILSENDNLGHSIIWDYRDDNGGVYKDPDNYLTVVIHPVVGVYANTNAVKFLRKLKTEYSERKSKTKKTKRRPRSSKAN